MSLNTIKILANKPYLIFGFILNIISPLFKNDETFLKLKYFCFFQKKIDFNNPKTYNEKLQWLKIHDKHKEYSVMVDKYEAKNYVGNIIGQQHIIPTLGIYTHFSDIDFNKLPSKFVIKCTHDSGGVVVCKDKNKLDVKSAEKKINFGLNNNSFWANREYPYKNIKPRIIIEDYMEDESGVELKDYKIHCFNGEPRFILVASGRYKNDVRFNFYDLNWNLMPFEKSHKHIDEDIHIQKPEKLDEMISLSKKLSKNIPHVRVDFYYVNDTIYFGELTFFPASGFGKFKPESWDRIIGDWLVLPNKKQ